MQVSEPDLERLSAFELSQLVQRREVSPVEIVTRSLDRLEAVQPAINAFVTVTPELALAAARRAEAAVMSGSQVSALNGIPVSVKDNIAVAGASYTFGSRTRSDAVAEASAPAVERLVAAGACIVGKTTMPEFGCKAASNSPLTGITRNPWDLSKSAGGSSSGCAAAVSAGVVPISLGTDGGGSLRIPSAFCGVFGLKPQFGRIPVYPPPAAPSMLHFGPITRTVRDAALLLDALAGYDPRDHASNINPPGPFIDACDMQIAGWRVAWSPTLGYAEPEAEVLEKCLEQVALLEDMGCIVEEVDGPFADPYDLFVAEFAPGLLFRLRELPPGVLSQVDPDVLEIVLRASKLTAADYFGAHFARHALRETMLGLFERYRLLLTPTLPVTAFDAEKSRPPDSPGSTVLSWPSYTAIHDLTGFPAGSVPCGRTKAGLPVGLQVAARPNSEADIFAAAAALEARHPWSADVPPMR